MKRHVDRNRWRKGCTRKKRGSETVGKSLMMRGQKEEEEGGGEEESE